MNLRVVFLMLGRLQMALAGALLIPAGVGWYTGEGDGPAFLAAAMIAGIGGVALNLFFRSGSEFTFGRREAFVLVTAAWVTASIVGALPYIFFKGPGFAMDALFESASGFTTTGASILTTIEGEAQGILLWRSLTHWLGGMGIIVLGIAILPKLAVGGMELLGAEAPGPITEKLTPRIASTAKALWGIYLVITVLEMLALKLLGMGWLEALNHAFATMATGGFSTRNASVGGFANPAIEMVVVFFMLMAGANFALHFHLIRGKPLPLLKDPEFRMFLGIIATATTLITLDLMVSSTYGNLWQALRYAVFQATSIVTTTGFATVDYEVWPAFSKAVLFLLMFVGGCAGSTGGSVKVVRIMIVLKKMVVDLKRMIRPHAVLPVRIGSKGIPEDVVTSVTTFFLLFLTLFALGGLLLSAMGATDLVGAFSASAACIGNIGPGFGLVGPAQNYAFFPAPAKLLLVCLMIVGRLELYTAMVLLFLWRKK
jgi:trk system potassium uptake protein TrkH